MKSSRSPTVQSLRRSFPVYWVFLGIAALISAILYPKVCSYPSSLNLRSDAIWALYYLAPHTGAVVSVLLSIGLPIPSLVDAYIKRETPIAKAGILANIGPHGAKSAGAKRGVVIASPSTRDPDYLYSWTRDSALVFKLLVDQFTLEQDTSLKSLIYNYVHAQTILQTVSNPSGSISTGGLGEPKFNIDYSAFTEPWGRPQRDGPALRATTLITYAQWLLANDNTSYVTRLIWPIVKLDLDYVSTHWNYTGFDLWEEVSSSSFFTTAVQHRALREGSSLAKQLGHDACATEYATQADNTLCFIQSYWNSLDGHIIANTGGDRSGKDANAVLASIHTFDATAGCDSVTFQPCSDKALSNLVVYIDAFRKLYPINRHTPLSGAIATGRYPEDQYMGGQPWYLTTFAVAEQLYDALSVWNKQRSLEVTNVSLAFFQQFLPSIRPGSYLAYSSEFRILTAAIRNFADGFVAVNAKYTPWDGSLAEQYHGIHGKPLSALDLTWSYASALTAFRARDGKVIPGGWGAKGLVVPSVCKMNRGPSVSVTFTVEATTVPGEDIYITGSTEALQNWSADSAVKLSPSSYPIWSITLDVPASYMLEFKYIRKFYGRVTWESDPNRILETPDNGVLTTRDVWR